MQRIDNWEMGTEYFNDPLYPATPVHPVRLNKKSHGNGGFLGGRWR
jgi:hypothetical protein